MKNKRPCILIIEDDANLVLTLTNYIESMHFTVKHAYNGREGLEIALKNSYQLAIIDLGLPNMSGFKVVERIRKINNKPIIIITGSKREEDELNAFRLRANIYHRKPIKFEILEEQIKSLINPNEKGNIVRMLDIYLDTKRRIIKINNEEIYLTKTEMDFVIMLVNSNGEIFTREQIIATIKNYFNNPSKYCVDTMVSRIRKKLRTEVNESLVKTVNGSGYTINPKYLENMTRDFS